MVKSNNIKHLQPGGSITGPSPVDQIMINGGKNLSDVWKAGKEKYNSMSEEQKMNVAEKEINE